MMDNGKLTLDQWRGRLASMASLTDCIRYMPLDLYPVQP